LARPKRISDEQVLAIAREILLRDGAKTSTATIAEAVGFSQASLFKRFGTKTQLLVEALRPRHDEALLHLLREGPQPGRLMPQLQHIGLQLHGFISECIPRIAVLRAHRLTMHDVYDDLEASPPLTLLTLLTHWFREADAQGRCQVSDPHVTAMMLLSAFKARAFWSHATGDAPPSPLSPEYADAVVHNLWHGIQPKELP